jgi:hypothetical protein
MRTALSLLYASHLSINNLFNFLEPIFQALLKERFGHCIEKQSYLFFSKIFKQQDIHTYLILEGTH